MSRYSRRFTGITLLWFLPLLSGCTGSSDLLPMLQWPAMVVTVAASWFVTSQYKDKRWVGFLLFIASNVLWTIWGIHTGATALVVLQLCLAVLNVLGLRRAGDPKKGGLAPAGKQETD